MNKKKIKYRDNENSNISLKDVEVSWPDILENIRKKRPSIGAVLENSKPVDYDGRIVTIQGSSQSEFNLKMVEKQATIVEELISIKMGQSLRIKLINGNSGLPGKSDKKDKKPKTGANPNDEKIFNRIVELFDGEILR